MAARLLEEQAVERAIVLAKLEIKTTIVNNNNRSANANANANAAVGAHFETSA